MVTLLKTEDENKLYYKACPSEKCNKKLIEENGAYFCSNCKNSFENYKLKYLLSGVINDHTGSIWVSIFDVATNLLNEKPDDFIPKLLDKQNFENYAEHKFMESKYVMWNMRVNARKPDKEGYDKPRYTLDRLEGLNFVNESKKLITQIQSYL